ncbi:MAG: hypothetical protein HUU50_15900 [Candidatus Brocadiae bacterium]|nr:hypothetical protein [Candidatus Brocadiia bacterium]
MKREENNFGFFLGLILALLSWILGGVAGLYIQFPELDQFPLIRDLGGHKLITIILLATLPGYVFFWIFQRFNHPTCVGIALALGYILGGIMGISFGVAIPWALGYATGLETMPLTIMMGLSGFGMGTTTMNAVALARWKDLKSYLHFSLFVHIGMFLGWAVSLPLGGEWPFAFMLVGIISAMFIAVKYDKKKI